MTTSQFFVYKRPVAWTLLVATLAWGCFAYRAMPQRHDPIIPIRIATVVTIYPGADAEKVEREVTRKIEKQVALCEHVEKVRSLSRQNLSVVFVDLFDRVKNPEQVWQDLEGRLESMTDLPSIAGRPIRPQLNKDFGETAALMLTISSPKVSDFEIHQRVESVCGIVAEFRRGRPARFRRDRLTAVLIYPNTVARSYVVWLGHSLLERLAERGLIEDGQIVEAPSTGCLDFQLVAGKSDEELIREAQRWERDTIGTGMSHPDMWKGHHRPRPADTGSEAFAEPSRSAGQARSLQLPGASPFCRCDPRPDEAISDDRQDRRNRHPGRGHLPVLQQPSLQRPRPVAADAGGPTATPQHQSSRRPVGDTGADPVLAAQRRIQERAGAGRSGGRRARRHPTYLRDMVDIVRGYEDPPGVMNYRSVKVDGDHPARAQTAGRADLRTSGRGRRRTDFAENARLQTTRAITLAVRQIKGTQIETFARDVQAALDSLKGILPERPADRADPRRAQGGREKIRQFDQNLIEAIAIVVLVAIVFMEWRSACWWPSPSR